MHAVISMGTKIFKGPALPTHSLSTSCQVPEPPGNAYSTAPDSLGECHKKGFKTYHPQGNVVADPSINVLELSGCSISPVARKSLLFKLSSKYQTNKMTQGHSKPMLAPLVLSVALWSLLWGAPPG